MRALLILSPFILAVSVHQGGSDVPQVTPLMLVLFISLQLLPLTQAADAALEVGLAPLHSAAAVAPASLVMGLWLVDGLAHGLVAALAVISALVAVGVEPSAPGVALTCITTFAAVAAGSQLALAVACVAGSRGSGLVWTLGAKFILLGISTGLIQATVTSLPYNSQLPTASAVSFVICPSMFLVAATLGRGAPGMALAHHFSWPEVVPLVLTSAAVYFIVALLLRQWAHGAVSCHRQAPRVPASSEFFLEGPARGIVASRVRVSFGVTDAVAGVDVTVQPGEMVGLLGPNGAGKTTLQGVLAGTLSPSAGVASINGRPVRGILGQRRPVVGLCPQSSLLPSGLTPLETLTYFAAIAGHSLPGRVADTLVKAVGLQEVAERRTAHLSGGTKRRLSAALAFSTGADCILLDEPTAGVDVLASTDVWHFLKRESEGKAILLTTHMLDEAEALCSRVAIMAHGRLVKEASLAEMLQDQASSLVLDVTLNRPDEMQEALRLDPDWDVQVEPVGHCRCRLVFKSCADRPGVTSRDAPILGDILEALEALGTVRHITFVRPSLEQAFNTLLTPTDGSHR